MARCRIGGFGLWPLALIWLLWTLALSGCASGRPGMLQRPPNPAFLVKAPLTLPPPRSGKLEDLMANHKLSAERYARCALQLNALIDEVQPQSIVVPWLPGWLPR